MMSLSVSQSLLRSPPLQFNPLRIVPSFHRFPQFLCSANLRASMSSQNSRVSVRLRAAHQPVAGKLDSNTVAGKLEMEHFASISSSNSQETSSVGINPQIPAPLPPFSRSPLFWTGVGVAFGTLCIRAVASFQNFFQKYAMQQAFKTLMAEVKSKNDQSSKTAFSPPTPATDVKNEAEPNTFDEKKVKLPLDQEKEKKVKLKFPKKRHCKSQRVLRKRKAKNINVDPGEQ